MARWVNKLAAALVVAAVGSFLAVASAPSTRADAAITAGDIVVDDVGGHVFTTYGDTVRVFDLEGTQVDTIADQPGAIDLFLRGRTLYVLAAGTPRINTVDADTLAVTGGWSLASVTNVRSMAWSNNKIWFTYGSQSSGGLGRLDPATGVVTGSLAASLYAGGDIAGADSPARIYVLDRGLSPSKIRKYDVTTNPPTLLSTSPHSNACANGRELALSTDGATAWTACGSPYKFNVFDTSVLAEPSVSYTSTNYPNAIDRSADGGFLVGGTQSTYGLDVWFYEIGNTTSLRSYEIGSSGLVPGMVAVSNGGRHIYAESADGVLHTWTLTPKITSVTPGHVAEGTSTVVEVTGTAFADVTSASVGGTSASFTVVSDTKVNITVPNTLAPGSRTVALTSRWGTTPSSPAAAVVVDPARPDAPAAPTSPGVGERSIDLQWVAPDDHGHDISSYTVKVYKDPGAVFVKNVVVPGTTTTVTGLISEQPYRFTVAATSSAGAGATSPMSAAVLAGNPDLGPHATLRTFVERAYQDIEGRLPSDAERSAAVEGLANGTVTPGAHLVSHRRGPDALNSVDPMARLYRATFLRIPDAAGLNYWVGKKRAGTKLTAIADTFARSSEFTRRYGLLTDRQYVERLYLNVLGRPGEPAGIDYWTGKLTSRSRTRGQVLAGMSESNEYKRSQASEVDVSTVFIALLRRAPTGSEFTTEVAALDGGGTLDDLVTRLLLSAEYDARY